VTAAEGGRPSVRSVRSTIDENLTIRCPTFLGTDELAQIRTRSTTGPKRSGSPSGQWIQRPGLRRGQHHSVSDRRPADRRRPRTPGLGGVGIRGAVLRESTGGSNPLGSNTPFLFWPRRTSRFACSSSFLTPVDVDSGIASQPHSANVIGEPSKKALNEVTCAREHVVVADRCHSAFAVLSDRENWERASFLTS
jgi:hypothetical protein